MSLHEDLLDQAEILMNLDARRPTQANLRRAVSAAYYALFHLLRYESSRMLISGSRQGPLRNLVGRAFSHSEMYRASKAFASAGLPPHIDSLLSRSVSGNLRYVAQAFLDLQESRHEADYDTSRRWSRNEVLQLVEQTRRSFIQWQGLRNKADGKAYLTSLLLWEKWKR